MEVNGPKPKQNMKTEELNKRISALPKWAQDHIQTLERQRKEAVDALNAAQDTATPTPVFFERHVCVNSGEGTVTTKHYIPTDRITVEYEGIASKLQRAGMTGVMSEVAMIPESFQQVRLVEKSRLR